MINNQSNLTYYLGNSLIKQQSNQISTIIINPIINFKISYFNDKYYLTFKNTLQTSIYDLKIKHDSDELFAQKVIRNNEKIKVNISDAAVFKLLISYHFLDKGKLNSIYVFRITLD